MPQEEIQGLQTIHSSAPACVVMKDGRSVEHFHDHENGDTYFRVGGVLYDHGFSNTADPMLHPDLGCIYRVGNDLRSVDPEDPGNSTLIYKFTGYGNVTIGQHEGPMVDNRYLPLVLDGSEVGVFDLEAADFLWAVPVPNGRSIDTGYVLVGQPDEVYCRASDNRVYHVRSDGSSSMIFRRGGHATSFRVGTEMWHLIEASDFRNADRARWGLQPGTQNWAFAIDMTLETERWRLPIDWVSQHYGPLTLPDGRTLVAMSYDNDVGVWHVNAPGGPVEIVPRFSTRLGETHPYTSQKKPQLGVRKKDDGTQEVVMFYTEGLDTWSEHVMDLTAIPIPPPGDEMSDLQNRKDALDTADPPIPYAEEQISLRVETRLTPTGGPPEYYDENGELLRIELARVE